MKTKIILGLFATVSIATLIQCNKNKPTTGDVPNLPSTEYAYKLNKQIHGKNNTPTNNQISNAGATLGRVLFYDKKLSINNQVACGSCHKQEDAFADKGFNLSNGFEGKKTGRNSSTIINVINQDSYFWDGRTVGLETMVMQPIRHQVEMGMEKPEVLVKKLSTITYYPELFEKAFGSREITSEKIGMAMAQFLRSMTSYNSFAEQTNMITPSGGWSSSSDPRITQSQKHGAQLFQNSGCTNCHNGSNFRGWNDEGTANIGLELNYVDKGMGANNDATLEGVFKIPSLRNVAKTAPYMHDGRFATLKEVVKHYNSGVVDHPNLSPILRNNTWGGGDNSPRKLNLSESDINDMVAFLEALTDQDIINDTRFSDPFKK